MTKNQAEDILLELYRKAKTAKDQALASGRQRRGEGANPIQAFRYADAPSRERYYNARNAVEDYIAVNDNIQWQKVDGALALCWLGEEGGTLEHPDAYMKITKDG